MIHDRLLALRHLIQDLIWPTLATSSRQAEEEQAKRNDELALIRAAVARLPSSAEEIKDHLANCEKLLEYERSRKASIESRLQSTAGLVSIAATVVLGALLSLATDKHFSAPHWALATVVVACFYLAVQLVAALSASLAGLKSTAYLADRPHSVLPGSGLARTAFMRGRVLDILERVLDDRLQNNKKLDQLNVAHCATKNFLRGLIVVAAVAGCVALYSTPQNKPSCPSDVRCPEKTQTIPSAVGTEPSATPEVSVNPVRGEIAAALVLAGIGTCLAASGIALIAVGSSVRSRVVGLAMTVGGVGIGWTGIGKLEAAVFKFDKLMGEIHLHLNWSSGTKAPVKQVLIRKAVIVGPFPDGKHILAGESPVPCITAALAAYKDFSIGGWEFVGRVDKRELTREHAGLYGSNQALAMSRASWVAQQTSTANLLLDLTSAIVTVGGAQRVGQAVGAEELQSDRVVDVFVLVNAPVNLPDSARLPLPVLCPQAHPGR